MIKPARPRDPASLPGEQSARDSVCLDMRASARTTQGGTRCIRTGGCAAIGPLARNRPTDPDDETGGPRKDIGAPDLRLSGAVDRVNLERSVEKLPPGYRTVFVLHDVQGYEHNEIADIMGCSVGNSKSQLHKARTRLRDLLQEEIRQQARQNRHAAKTQTGHHD